MCSRGPTHLSQFHARVDEAGHGAELRLEDIDHWVHHDRVGEHESQAVAELDHERARGPGREVERDRGLHVGSLGEVADEAKACEDDEEPQDAVGEQAFEGRLEGGREGFVERQDETNTLEYIDTGQPPSGRVPSTRADERPRSQEQREVLRVE
jgi:hypothetical protein